METACPWQRQCDPASVSSKGGHEESLSPASHTSSRFWFAVERQKSLFSPCSTDVHVSRSPDPVNLTQGDLNEASFFFCTLLLHTRDPACGSSPVCMFSRILWDRPSSITYLSPWWSFHNNYAFQTCSRARMSLSHLRTFALTYIHSEVIIFFSSHDSVGCHPLGSGIRLTLPGGHWMANEEPQCESHRARYRS